MDKIFIINNNQEMTDLTTRMCNAEITKPLRLTVSVHKSDRSLSQNRLMWKWYGELREYIRETQGPVFSTQAIHEHIMPMFLEARVSKFFDEVTKTYSTSKLSMKAFAKYLQDFDMHCSEHYGLTLTHPEDLYLEAIGGKT